MPLVYIGVGSNLGDREKNIRDARRLLEENGISVTRLSPLYTSNALCRPGETMPDFLNGVFEIATTLKPEELLQTLEEIERSLGRKGKGDWSPRSIDLDLLLYGNEILETKRLKVPHPKMEDRWFVLKPLADLVPNLIHPILKRPIKELLSGLDLPANPLP